MSASRPKLSTGTLPRGKYGRRSGSRSRQQRTPGPSISVHVWRDGASFAAPDAYSSIIKDTLAKTAARAEDALGLVLRVALIPIADIRARHLDVLVARFAPSSNVTYAMFAGGGLARAERELKNGRYAVPRAPVGETADLTEAFRVNSAPISTKHGVILSLIIIPRDDPTSFMELIQELFADAPPL